MSTGWDERGELEHQAFGREAGENIRIISRVSETGSAYTFFTPDKSKHAKAREVLA